MFNNKLCRKALWNFYFYFRNIRWTGRRMAGVTAIQLTFTVITLFIENNHVKRFSYSVFSMW